MNEMTLTLNSPITEEQWDAITDVDFEHTNEITFYTKHGKEVKFVKASAQPDIIRCRDCKWHNGEINQCNAQVCASMHGEDFCSKAERREDGRDIINPARSFEGIRDFLESHEYEGIVFWLNDEPMCKIKRTDFGFEWPIKK